MASEFNVLSLTTSPGAVFPLSFPLATHFTDNFYSCFRFQFENKPDMLKNVLIKCRKKCSRSTVESCAVRVAGTRTAMRAGAGRVEPAAGRERVVLDAGRGPVEKFFLRVLSVEPKHMNLISSKNAKHVDVLKLFASIALRTAGPHRALTNATPKIPRTIPKSS